ncbi:MAG: hypothetical protein MJ133_00830 [Lachnospiraceae bacterium]|nr:hypothetical protein [Lachnospiraceae bacterium]
MKRKGLSGINIGLSSILMIIVIISLVCFAGLSLASSNADNKLCLKLADRTSAYYEAVSKAYTSIYEENQKESSRIENSFEFQIDINENQALKVVGLLNPDNDTNYHLSDFRIITLKMPELDDSLSLLLGDG